MLYTSSLLTCLVSIVSALTIDLSLKLAPKVIIISMFPPEASVWYGIKDFNVLARNYTVPGLSPLFPDVHCTSIGDVCQVTIGESEINAASSVTALSESSTFDFTKTYWLVAGISGVNPNVATIGGVSFARFAVQVGLQYEIDSREIPSNFSTGYFPLHTTGPGQYPSAFYGTEVFELNAALRSKAAAFASPAKLNDSADAIAYRTHYSQSVAKAGPGIYECDVATSDVYYSGKLLSDSFSAFTSMMTNGTATYCSTAQEDNATLEALLRSAKAGKVDFARIIVMRTFSDFDQPYPGEDPAYNLLFAPQGGFLPAIANIYLAGIKVVEGILQGWNSDYKAGIKPTNYIGDVFGTLGGKPDFGPGSGFTTFRKRDTSHVASRKDMYRKLASST